MSINLKKFIWEKSSDLIIAQCNDCVHYQGDGKCKAYPRRIPDAIFTNDHDHTEPYRNDNGIRFKEK